MFCWGGEDGEGDQQGYVEESWEGAERRCGGKEGFWEGGFGVISWNRDWLSQDLMCVCVCA